MRKIKSIIKEFLKKTHLYSLNKYRNNFYIIPYHMIADRPNGVYPETAVSVFEKQIRYLATNYSIISLDSLVDRIKKKQSLRGCVAITFDDGFKDNYTNAWPILKKYNVPATIFLLTGCIEDGKAPWFIKFRHAFMNTKKDHLYIDLEDETFSLPLHTSKQRFQASNRIMAYFKSCKNEERLRVLEEIFEKLKAKNLDLLDDLMLNWDQIKEMADRGISFGAHTVTHPVLSRVSIETAKQELSISKATIESELMRPVTSCAYPFGGRGEYTSELFPILEEFQFNCAVTTEEGRNSLKTGIFELNRPIPWEFSIIQ